MNLKFLNCYPLKTSYFTKKNFCFYLTEKCLPNDSSFCHQCWVCVHDNENSIYVSKKEVDFLSN